MNICANKQTQWTLSIWTFACDVTLTYLFSQLEYTVLIFSCHFYFTVFLYFWMIFYCRLSGSQFNWNISFCSCFISISLRKLPVIRYLHFDWGLRCVPYTNCVKTGACPTHKNQAEITVKRVYMKHHLSLHLWPLSARHPYTIRGCHRTIVGRHVHMRLLLLMTRTAASHVRTWRPIIVQW